MHDLTFKDVSLWDEISPVGLSPKEQKAFQSRRNAVFAVAKGHTIASAAKRHGVNARTLVSTIQKAISKAPDGRPWGWRACLPHRVRLTRATAPEEFPPVAGPGAFSAFLRKATEFQERLVNYSGSVPERNAPSTKFEAFFKTLCAWIRGAVPKDRYPANDKTYARRSIIEFIKKQRKGHPFIDDDFQVEDAAIASQLGEVFALQPGDWVQYDGHSLDCEFHVEGEDADGNPYLQQISKTWLLVGYMALLRLCSSWMLSFTKNYNGTDFNQVCANSLRQWTPREILAPSMVYVPGSGIGTVEAIGFVASGAITSIDNAMAHKLDVNRQRMARELLGVIHFGRSGVPETRGHLEAWNKRIEEAVVRELPGGYRPAGENSDTPTRTNSHAPEQYPVVIEALEDLMDITISASNVTGLDAFQQRSPTQVLQSYIASGGWIFATRDHEARASELSKLSCSVVSSGSKQKKRQPYVRYRYARYRSVSLKNRWDLVGQRFAAQIDIHDGRFLRLYNEKGELFVVLRAARPWGRSAHSLALRKLICRLARQGRFEIRGVKDTMPVFREYLRKQFHASREAATMAIQYRQDLNAAAALGTADSQPTSAIPTGKPAPSSVDVYVPLSGRVTLGKKGGTR